MYFST